MRALAVLLVMLAPACASAAGAVSEQQCDEDRDAFYLALERSRERTLEQIRLALADAGGEAEREHLRAERDEAWHEEERMRGFGDNVWRDCLRGARGAGKAR